MVGDHPVASSANFASAFLGFGGRDMVDTDRGQIAVSTAAAMSGPWTWTVIASPRTVPTARLWNWVCTVRMSAMTAVAVAPSRAATARPGRWSPSAGRATRRR